MELSDLAKKMTRTILIISVVSILISAVYYRSLEFLPFMYGILLGAAVSISKVILLERAVNRALEMGQKKAGNYVTLQHVMRMLLSGVVLVLGAIVPQISLWGVAVGILAFQLAIYGMRLTEH